MIKTVGIVSLSRGIVGEDDIKFEVEIGLRRLREYGLTVKFLPNARKGLDYIRNHPEKRAEDLLQAFRDPEIDMILCASGGDDTFRLLPYLFDHNELRDAVSQKVFLGFSDTTVNHFMLHKVGLHTFYGQSFLADICELGPQMLPYSRKYFEELIFTVGKLFPVKPGMKSGRASLPIKPARSCRPILTAALSCCRAALLFPERFLAAVLTPYMISSAGNDMPTCLCSARNISYSQIRRIGKIVSCSWNPVKRNRLQRNTGGHWSISRKEEYLTLFPASWQANRWMTPMHRNTSNF